MKKILRITIKTLCVIPIIAEGYFVLFQMLISYTLSATQYMYMFIMPFIFRNMSITYYLTKELKMWNMPYYILDVLIAINALFIILNIEPTLEDVDYFLYIRNHFNSYNYLIIIYTFIPFCVRLIFFFYFAYSVFSKQFLRITGTGHGLFPKKRINDCPHD